MFLSSDFGGFAETGFNMLVLSGVDFSKDGKPIDLEIDITNKKSIVLRRIRGVKSLKITGYNENLKDIAIYRNDFNKLIGIENIPNLTSLTFTESKLVEVPSGIEKLTKLNSLDLSSNNISDVSNLSNLIEKPMALTKLLLKNNSIGPYNVSTNTNNDTIFSNLYDNGLRTLDLSNNNFYKGQLSSTESKFGSGLTINYIE